MPVPGQPRRVDPVSRIWAGGGRHLRPSGDVDAAQTHDEGHLVYAAAGVLTLHTGHGTSIVPADRIGWIPAGCAHRHRTHGETDIRIVFLPASLSGLVPEQPAVFVASGLAREVLLALTGPDGPGPARGPITRARLLRVLVDELHDANEQPLHLPEPRDDRVLAVARRLDDDPADGASLAELGRAVGASPRTLSRLFRRELGMTFYEWRTQLRIHHALVLLAEGHDITRTAAACGWANPSSFIAAFTAVLGTTPGRHRSGAGSGAGGP
jgi:AraC-like DNA-binding protein